ncbi:NAD-dependent epimerase/dehydratase family protein [Sinimarinibacterium sp. CAU 1509]|uniref:NAD-dependent epimerase/dehydratase family protein n=1 Tax=Sinimarinibacterium sp. CAU 1509 TaxID=2562283 RepID=UPI0010AC6308|nr:NAD-dependent epimerase/dehydratase family protein [Sinimarinibacterium sp. CAU 1509]TJY64695.1 NAD-dependent epimerase/dehydratase family protein [Sinimarinibacterium sp. CAU 1509]
MNRTHPALSDSAWAESPPPSLIAGCGDIGLRVSQRLRQCGGEVTAIVRDPQKASALERGGCQVRIENLDRPSDAGDWPLLFWFAPPPVQGVEDTRLRAWLAAQRGRIRRVIYISTSGVYGDCEGRWIDENAALRPQSDRARRRVDAEAAWAQWAQCSGAEVITLRVPGIYGPGRWPLERLRQGMPVLRPEDSPWSNRIHADDLAQAAVLAAQRGQAGRAYNVADGTPTTMCDYFTRCARAFGLPQPEQVDRDTAQRIFTPAMWSFMEESKRLLIDRARTELGFVPQYPDLASGLADVSASDR